MGWAIVFGLLIPVAMIASYPVFMLAARRGPNCWFGYRTQRSWDSPPNWVAAQHIAARYWVMIGGGLLAASIALLVALRSMGAHDAEYWMHAAALMTVPQMIGMFITIPLVERRLRRMAEAA